MLAFLFIAAMGLASVAAFFGPWATLSAFNEPKNASGWELATPNGKNSTVWQWEYGSHYVRPVFELLAVPVGGLLLVLWGLRRSCRQARREWLDELLVLAMIGGIITSVFLLRADAWRNDVLAKTLESDQKYGHYYSYSWGTAPQLGLVEFATLNGCWFSLAALALAGVTILGRRWSSLVESPG